MEQIIYRLTLETHKGGIQKTLQGFKTEDKLSRKLCLYITDDGKPYEIPEDVMALVYIKPYGSSEPSIEEATINENCIEYTVMPITVEGIADVQVKLIETDTEGAKSVLMSASFALEVENDGMSDADAEQQPVFTALEQAVARAKETYDSRLLRVEFDEAGVFHAYYADDTEYINARFGELFSQTLESALSASVSEEKSKIYSEIADEARISSTRSENIASSMARDSQDSADYAKQCLDEVIKRTIYTTFNLNIETGNLEYDSQNYVFIVNAETGNLEWTTI